MAFDAKQYYRDYYQRRYYTDPEYRKRMLERGRLLKAEKRADKELRAAELAKRREQYANDPEFRAKAMAYRKIKTDEGKTILAEFRKDGCKFCGEKSPVCLDAHHVDPSEKDKTISKIVVTPKKLAAELAKCICVCANCHRKIHAGEIAL